jgi:ribose-phosphate pyrophosphokinase
MLFFPDEGAMKRYSTMFDLPYTFGIKKRDWTTGQIKGLEVTGQTEELTGSVVLIVDDICSKGGTFYHSAKALRELGAKDVYLYVSHCENSIFEGELLKSDLVTKVYTTNSIFAGVHNRVEVFDYE